MIFFLIGLLLVASLRGMENNNSLPPLAVTYPIFSLQDIALRKACCLLIDKKIPVEKFNTLPQDIREKIVESKVILFTPTITKQYFFSSLTPDHRYMLGKQDENNFFRCDVNSKQEIPLNLCEPIKGELIKVILSPLGNLIAVSSMKQNKLLVKDIVKNEIKEERRWRLASKDMVFIGQAGLLIEDWNQNLHCLWIENKLEEYSNTFKYLGVLHTTSEYLTQNGSSIMKNKISGEFSSIEIKDLEHISSLQPAIYEPDMLMAYQDKRAGLVHVVSLQENNKSPFMCNPAQCVPAPQITALSFAYKGKWLIVASADKEKAQLAILDWKMGDCLYKKNFADTEYIKTISYTDQPSQHPCMLGAKDPRGFMIYLCDPIKLVAADRIRKYKHNIHVTRTVIMFLCRLIKSRDL